MRIISCGRISICFASHIKIPCLSWRRYLDCVTGCQGELGELPETEECGFLAFECIAKGWQLW
jgi:hypothetical protein